MNLKKIISNFFCVVCIVCLLFSCTNKRNDKQQISKYQRKKNTYCKDTISYDAILPLKQDSGNIEIGIIEQCFNDDLTDTLVFRFVFVKKNSTWSLPEKELETKTMNICFDGKNLGTLKIGASIESIAMEDVNTYSLINQGSFPKTGSQSIDFSGWNIRPVYRPLVCNSHLYCKDDEKWKPYICLNIDSISVLQYLLKTYHFKVDNSTPIISNINKSYISSISGKKLISINISEPYRMPTNNEDYEVNNNYKAWFYLNVEKIYYLNSNMLLLDAADYDNDGAVEVIFKVEKYDYDGYVLYYGNYENKVEFGWEYH